MPSAITISYRQHGVLQQYRRAGTVLALMLAPAAAWAEPTTTADTFMVSLGSYAIFKSDTSVSLTERNLGTGVALSPQDTLGVDVDESVVRLDARYRFTPEHAISFIWYRISTEGSRELEHDIDWLNESGEQITLSAGAQVDTDFSYNIYSLNYNWSFYQNDKVELFASAGLHSTRFAIDLDASVEGSNISQEEAMNVASTVPLPVLGLGLRYWVTQDLSWFMQTQLFALKYEDWNGTFSNLDIGIEYRVLPHLGVGLGVGTNSLNVTESTDEYRFAYSSKLTGVNLFLSSSF